MKIFTSVYILLISLLVINCNGPKPAKTSIVQNVNIINVTATKDDLCRIVLKQQVFVDTSISRDKKTMVMTLLSDGTGLEVLFDESSLSDLYNNFSYPTEYYLSYDKKVLLYNLDFEIGNHYVCNNIFLIDMDTKKRDSLFCEESTYTHKRYPMFIESFKLNPAANFLIVSTNEFVRCFDLRTKDFYDIKYKVPFELMWINNTSFYLNKGYNKKWECQLYDISTKKAMSFLPNDTLPLRNISATLQGDRIFKYIYIDSDSGKLGDSLCFFNKDFKSVSRSFISNSQSMQYKMDLSGNWIYYTDERALRRIRVKDVEGSTLSLENFNVKSQVIYPFPIITEGNDISEIASGIITQLLPVENGGK